MTISSYERLHNITTGTTINVIRKKFLEQNPRLKRFKIQNEKFTFRTASGKTCGVHFVEIYINKIPIKCFVCNFHKNLIYFLE